MEDHGTLDLAGGLARLSRAEDPQVAARLATELLDTLGRLQMTVSQIRDDAVLELHSRGGSLHDIARLTHLSRGRVFQIVKRGREAAALPSPRGPGHA